jgi:branched-chain amino acid aminotransferase
MVVINGAIRLAAYHWERLFAGLKLLQLDVPVLHSPQWLEQQVLDTVARNNAEGLCRVRLQFFAGGGGLYGAQAGKAGFVIECFELNEEAIALNENGLVLGIAEGLVKACDMLSNVKSCNALIYAMGARQAKAQKCNDVLLRNTAGNLIETTLANVFWIKNDIVHTPPLTDGCIAGVMRRHIIAKMPVVEASLTDDGLMTADEVFVTNAVKGIKWVKSVNNNSYQMERVKKLHNLVFQL